MSETATAAPETTAAPAEAAPAAAPQDWRATLPPELREAPSIAKFQDPAALAKSYAELETLIGRKGVIVPTEKDGPDVHAAYRKALGIPESADGYELKPPAGAEAAWHEDTAKAFAAKAHAIGLTPTQAKAVAEWYGGLATEQMKAAAEGIEPDGRKMEDVLRSEWGAAYPAKVEMAKRAAKAFAPDASVLDALEAKVGGSALLRMFASIGEKMGEDVPAGMGQGRSGAMTPADAAAELARIRGDIKGPYWDRMHPEHKFIVERALSLQEMASR